MYKLMIVDDEKAMCELLAEIIPWKELGVEVIGTCKNGFDACEKAMELHPDIMLTDIMMPGMNGLELIRRLTEEGEETRFILLSAYGEFEYARQAMKYNVKHYLLKPCNEEQIKQAVSEICSELVRNHALDQKKEPEKRYSDITKKVLHLVEEELANTELSLKWIAENRLFMNVDYISKKFSADTGQKFSTYLNAFRMNKARELLISGEYTNIYAVADAVGYGNNPQYFSQIFKKMTGVSPTEYIKKMN
ncbi:MAG: response regulator [Candidatus Limivivens sp.]|nr:response regulator [Candidatus Limivivens sp.]